MGTVRPRRRTDVICLGRYSPFFVLFFCSVEVRPFLRLYSPNTDVISLKRNTDVFFFLFLFPFLKGLAPESSAKGGVRTLLPFERIDRAPSCPHVTVTRPVLVHVTEARS